MKHIIPPLFLTPYLNTARVAADGRANLGSERSDHDPKPQFGLKTLRTIPTCKRYTLLTCPLVWQFGRIYSTSLSSFLFSSPFLRFLAGATSSLSVFPFVLDPFAFGSSDAFSNSSFKFFGSKGDWGEKC